MAMLRTVEELEAALATPDDALVDDVARLQGDILVLGAGGKMGPSLARLARAAVVRAGVDKRVMAVARFSESAVQADLAAFGVETIRADLMDERVLKDLPDADNILYLVGHKFGTVGQEPLTWAMNTWLPGLVAERYRDARIVAYSTGNVYPFVPVISGGATEATPTAPIGEYAQSCLGRERLLAWQADRHGTPALLFRLNYAIDLRYGILLDVARAVYEDRPVALAMGHVNVIWQGDANAFALRALHHCTTSAPVLNVTGPETIALRYLAHEFAVRFGREPRFVGEESPTALLSNAGRAFGLFGYPRTTLTQMIDWVAHWVQAGGVTHGKPTHFEEREGRF